MKELLNLQEKETQRKIKLSLKFRRDMIKLAANTPLFVSNFCKEFQKNDIKLLKEFKRKIETDNYIKNFLYVNEGIYRYKLIEYELNYKEIFNFFFGRDRKYERNARKFASFTGYFFLEFLYPTINYINDNFPVKRKRELTSQEKHIIKFLIFRGDEIDYQLKYKISPNMLSVKIKEICENYMCKDINYALNLILIEKYFKEENYNVLETLYTFRGAKPEKQINKTK